MKRKKPGLKAFAVGCAVLISLSAVLLVLAESRQTEYEALLKVTQAPTPTVHAIRLDAAVRAEAAYAAGTPTAAPAGPTPAPQPTSEPAPTQVLLSQGASGEGVRLLQEKLKELDFYSGELDGQFGSGTRSAVKAFQSQHGLSADGIAGEKTWQLLFSGSASPREVKVTPSPVAMLDGEKPMLVNKQHPVDREFVPADLVYLRDVIPSDLAVLADSDAQGVEEAVLALKDMLEAAVRDGIGSWKIREAYRTWAAQERIFNNYVNRFLQDGRTRQSAISATRQTVADPGTSEHHSGLAFDLNAANTSDAFVDTAQYAWLYNHCTEYGFVIRYTDEKEDITGFLGEEWHYRYVGREHAERMQEMDMCLEEYLEWLGAI